MKQNLLIDKYRKVKSAYTGMFVEKYLNQFYRETNDEFAKRQQNIAYLNYTKSVVESIVNPIFSDDIFRGNLNDITTQFLNNIDVKGSTIDDMMWNAMIYYKLMGNYFLIINNTMTTDIDENETDTYESTLDETLMNRDFPYVTGKDLTELYRYDIDDYGKLTAIEFINEIEFMDVTTSTSPLGSPIHTPIKEIEIIGYNDEFIYEYCVNAAGIQIGETKSIPNPFGFIPVISMNAEITPYPPFYDFASTNLEIMNQLSESRRQERESVFSILEIVTDLEIKDIELGSLNIMTRPTTASGSSQFLSPDANIISTLRESAKDMVDLLLRQADLLGVTLSDTHLAKSGTALAYEFKGKDFELKRNAKIGEETEKLLAFAINKIISLILWEPTYPKEFLDPINEVSKMTDVLIKFNSLGIPIPSEVIDYITTVMVSSVKKEQ